MQHGFMTAGKTNMEWMTYIAAHTLGVMFHDICLLPPRVNSTLPYIKSKATDARMLLAILFSLFDPNDLRCDCATEVR